jgi:hypothetical protein
MAPAYLDRTSETRPLCLLALELFAPGGRELVVLRPPFVLRFPPLGDDEPPLLEAVQGRVERARRDGEHLRGEHRDALHHVPPIQRPGPQETQDEHLDRALQEIGLLFLHTPPIDV